MRQRIVLWGKNDKDEKVLVASRLLEREGMVETTVFPGSELTEIFVNTMMNAWREGTDIVFHEPFETSKKKLAIIESFLPEGIVVDREDVIVRAQTEWNFVVMSVKMSDVYYKQLEELRERVEQISQFDSGLWEELKGFWNKVQVQIRENNLIREHSTQLREHTNKVFNKLKDLRKSMDTDFRNLSQTNKERFESFIQEIENKIEGGMGLQPLFEELKELQRKLRNAKMTRDHRNKVWNRIDKAFKAIKAKRFGDKPQSRSAVGRLNRRYEGLFGAIQKMQNSIDRDQKDLNFQDSRVENSLGQLELEMRKAKIKMIEERIRSKKAKLKEMHRTKQELEAKIEKEKAREEAKKAEAAKEQPEEATETQQEQAEESASGGNGQPKEEQGLGQAAARTIGESLTDVVDTVRAVAEVVIDQISEKVKTAAEGNSGEEEE